MRNLNTKESFKKELIINFSKKHKIIPSKFHYDLKGSKYFEKITKAKEYYVTTTEKEIIKKKEHKIHSMIDNS